METKQSQPSPHTLCKDDLMWLAQKLDASKAFLLSLNSLENYKAFLHFGIDSSVRTSLVKRILKHQGVIFSCSFHLINK